MSMRLFFALQPPLELAASVLESASPLLAALQARAAPASNLHATLCFLGSVEPERLEALRTAASQVRAAPVALRLDAFDYWNKPRVLVAAATEESTEASALSMSLHERASAAGFSPDPKPFRAHLTLARKISPTDAAKISWPQNISPGFVVRCERFSLMESTKGEHGSIYSVIDSWPLYATEDSRVTQ